MVEQTNQILLSEKQPTVTADQEEIKVETAWAHLLDKEHTPIESREVPK